MGEPSIRYAKTKDGVSIAYATLGDGMPMVGMVTLTSIQRDLQIPEWRGNGHHLRDNGANPQEELLRKEAGVRVAEALAGVPLRYRSPLVLREMEGWSYRDIASALNCREGTVKSRVHRGRQRLRRLLEPYWNGGRG